jgi:hypothetical protein
MANWLVLGIAFLLFGVLAVLIISMRISAKLPDEKAIAFFGTATVGRHCFFWDRDRGRHRRRGGVYKSRDEHHILGYSAATSPQRVESRNVGELGSGRAQGCHLRGQWGIQGWVDEPVGRQLRAGL